MPEEFGMVKVGNCEWGFLKFTPASRNAAIAGAGKSLSMTGLLQGTSLAQTNGIADGADDQTPSHSWPSSGGRLPGLGPGHSREARRGGLGAQSAWWRSRNGGRRAAAGRRRDD